MCNLVFVAARSFNLATYEALFMTQ